MAGIKFLLVAIAALVASCNAFVVPSAPVVSKAAAPQITMSAKPAQQIAAVSTALLTAAPALAAEGTSKAFGVDSPLLVAIPLAVLTAINVIFFQWAGTQSEGDFFGEYDERRS